MSSKSLQIVYAALAVIGLCVTWYFNLQIEDLSLSVFIRDSYATLASTSVANDIIVVGLAFLVWSWIEAKRLQMRHWWFYAVLSLTVALALAFPLFLLMRERKISAVAA